MASLPKQIFQNLAQIAKQTGEAIIKEPLEIVKTAGQQTGLGSADKGIETPQGGGTNPQQLARLKKKQEEDRKKIEFYRQRLRELTAAPAQAPEISEEERQQQLMAEAAKKQKKQEGIITAPGGPSKRGTALIGGRKKKGGSEMMPAKSR